MKIAKLTISLSEAHLLDLMEKLIEARITIEQSGGTMSIHMGKESKEEKAVTLPSAEVVTPETVQAPATVHPHTGRRVVYRVIDPSVVVGRVPHTVRMLLLTGGPTTAKSLEAQTGFTSKSIESALWTLRDQGSIESVPMQVGVPVVQKKFKKADILAGTPTANE